MTETEVVKEQEEVTGSQEQLPVSMEEKRFDTNTYRVLFRSVLGLLVCGFCAAFLWKAAFIPKAYLNEYTGVIVGFITGTAFGSILMFYFGDSDRSRKTVEEKDHPETP